MVTSKLILRLRQSCQDPSLKPFKNKMHYLHTANQPNLMALQPSRAKLYLLHFWCDFSEILDSGSANQYPYGPQAQVNFRVAKTSMSDTCAIHKDYVWT